MKRQVNIRFEKQTLTDLDIFLAANRDKYSNRSELVEKIICDFISQVIKNGRDHNIKKITSS